MFPKLIALIPARKGSKGVIRKNMRLVNGTPLVGYTLRSALESEYISHTFVSSDDNELLAYASSLGCNCVVRPKEYAADSSTANDVIRHFISGLDRENFDDATLIAYLQPTSPLRTYKHIDQAYEEMLTAGLSSAVSVCRDVITPFKSFKLKDGKLLSLFSEKITNENRQKLPKTYHANGALYIFSISDFLRNDGLPSNGAHPFLMNSRDSLDIDSEEDLYLFAARNDVGKDLSRG